MSDTTLRDLVLKRLDADTKPEDEWSALVLAALEGPDELAKLLDEEAPSAVSPRAPCHPEAPACHPEAPKAPRDPPSSVRRAPPPRIAFLRTITVEGFRGIGPKATLDLTPGPGLTLVVGRNGSGKSSFAEGLELLLTGDTYRWRDRSRIWRDGWRNLHHPKAALAADFALEGERGACTVACEWPEGAELEAAASWAQVKGKPRTPKDALGWKDALESHRPFLSYNELGSLLDEGPSKLYDALAKVLGLDALVDAQNALQQARSARDKAVKDADQRPEDDPGPARRGDRRAGGAGQGGARKEGVGPGRGRGRPGRIADDRRQGRRHRPPQAPGRPPAPRPERRRRGRPSPEGRRTAPDRRRPVRGGEVGPAGHPPRPRPELPQSPRRRRLPRLRKAQRPRHRLAPAESPRSRGSPPSRKRSHRSQEGGG